MRKIVLLNYTGILRSVLFDLETSGRLPAKVIQDCSQQTRIFEFSPQRNP